MDRYIDDSAEASVLFQFYVWSVVDVDDDGAS